MPATRSKPPFPRDTSLLFGHNASAWRGVLSEAEGTNLVAPRLDETCGSESVDMQSLAGC
jgi:hypothetical protein